VALDYLRNQRHLADDVIKQFQFGYCPRDVDHELAGRIIMPIFDAYGENVVAFSSRDTEAPKRYQHWHEQFDKTNHLFGLNVAKPHIKRTKKAIVVEGQFDVTYLHTAGFKMTVGLCGSAFSIMHVALLSRYCSEIFIIMDPDTSGDSAVERAAVMYEQYNLGLHNLVFIPVSLPSEPNKLDPDDFVYQNGPQALINILRADKENATKNLKNILNKAKKRKQNG
jgi:DNA primase